MPSCEIGEIPGKFSKFRCQFRRLYITHILCPKCPKISHIACLKISHIVCSKPWQIALNLKNNKLPVLQKRMKID